FGQAVVFGYVPGSDDEMHEMVSFLHEMGAHGILQDVAQTGHHANGHATNDFFLHRRKIRLDMWYAVSTFSDVDDRKGALFLFRDAFYVSPQFKPIFDAVDVGHACVLEIDASRFGG